MRAKAHHWSDCPWSVFRGEEAICGPPPCTSPPVFPLLPCSDAPPPCIPHCQTADPPPAAWSWLQTPCNADCQWTWELGWKTSWGWAWWMRWVEKETGRWWGKLYDAGKGLGWSLGMMASAICLGRNHETLGWFIRFKRKRRVSVGLKLEAYIPPRKRQGWKRAFFDGRILHNFTVFEYFYNWETKDFFFLFSATSSCLHLSQANPASKWLQLHHQQKSQNQNLDCIMHFLKIFL